MNPEIFIQILKNEILKNNLDSYRAILENKNTQKFWPDMVSFCQQLSKDQLDLYFKNVEQIIVDTASSILGVLDGNSYFGGYQDDFNLTYSNNKSKINGFLQDLFLEYIQNDRDHHSDSI